MTSVSVVSSSESDDAHVLLSPGPSPPSPSNAAAAAAAAQAADDDHVDGVPEWLAQLRGGWEDELTDAAHEEWLGKVTDDIKQTDQQQSIVDQLRIIEQRQNQREKEAVSQSLRQSPKTSRPENSEGKAVVDSIASQVLDALPAPSSMTAIRKKFGQLFSMTRSSSIEDSISADLRKQQNRARTLALIHEKKILRFNTQRKKVDADMKEDLAKWERWAMDSLASIGRTYFETKRLHLDSLIEVDVHLVDFYRRVEEALEQKQKGSSSVEARISTKLFREDGSVIPVDDLELPSNIEQMKQSCQGMEAVIKHLHDQYTDVQKEAMRTETNEERKLKIVNILQKCLNDASQLKLQSSLFHYHEPDRVTQAAFNRLMLDERQREGQLIKHWMTLLRDTLRTPNRRVTSEAIEAFLDYLMKYLFKQYQLGQESDKFARPLRLCIDRMIYPRISRTIRRLRTTLEYERDKCFRRKTRWLWRVTQEQLGIVEEFRSPIDYDLAAPPPGMMTSPSNGGRSRSPSPSSSTASRSLLLGHSQSDLLCPLPEDFPFIEPIRLLSRLETECVPSNMLFCLMQTITEVQKSCRRYAGRKDAVIDADTLFPVVVWTVVHANASSIHQRLGHILRSVSDQQRNFGEVGFCLSLIEASVAYILQLKPSKFGLSDALDEDIAPVAAIATTATSPETTIHEECTEDSYRVNEQSEPCIFRSQNAIVDSNPAMNLHTDEEDRELSETRTSADSSFIIASAH